MHVPDAINANELRVYFRTLINNSLLGNLGKKNWSVACRADIIFLKVAQCEFEETRSSLPRQTIDDIDRGVLSGIINKANGTILRIKYEFLPQNNLLAELKRYSFVSYIFATHRID